MFDFFHDTFNLRARLKIIFTEKRTHPFGVNLALRHLVYLLLILCSPACLGEQPPLSAPPAITEDSSSPASPALTAVPDNQEILRPIAETVKTEEPSNFSRSADWLINKRNEWSGIIGDTGAQLDGFFAGRAAEIRTNGSFLRLGFETKYEKNGELKLDPILRFKLDLPTTEERLKLVVESDSLEQKSLGEANRDRTLTKDERSSTDTTGSLQLVSAPERKWKASTSIGLRFRNPPDPFWRAKAKRKWDISNDWTFRVLQSLYYFHEDGWGETTRLVFEKQLSSYFFRTRSEAKWEHNERTMEYAQVFSLKKELSTTRAIRYQLGILGENQPTVRTTDYYVNAAYRRLIYKDWLFYEMIPELLFPRDDSFKPNPSLTFRLEVVFSSID